MVVLMIMMIILVAVVVRKIKVLINERRYIVLVLEIQSETVTIETN